MGKAVLVMGMPDSCIDCPCYKGGSVLRCGVDLSSLTDKEIREKPNWCPLRPVPEKKVEESARTMTDLGWINGWNACIDEICESKK